MNHDQNLINKAAIFLEFSEAIKHKNAELAAYRFGAHFETHHNPQGVIALSLARQYFNNGLT